MEMVISKALNYVTDMFKNETPKLKSSLINKRYLNANYNEHIL